MMKFLISNDIVILTVFNIFLATAINARLPFPVREMDGIPKFTRNPPAPMEHLYGIIYVENDAKDEILATVAYTLSGIPEVHSVLLKPGKFKKFEIPSVARNAVIVIEEWSLCSVNQSTSPSQMVPCRRVILNAAFNQSSTSNRKCYMVAGAKNNMKVLDIPCIGH